ncbi:hypothetical protein HK405_008603 [Cladochytrium tenue]|nr:hypothetical protein HK405_008603 [Cladochytrium tenue]
MTDRELFDKSVRALVSWVRHYKEHLASSIFRLGDVEFGPLAMALGVLRMPRMPELKGVAEVPGFVEANVDVGIPYHNKVRERQRRQRLKAERDGLVAPKRLKKKAHGAGRSEAWSEQKAAKLRRDERRDKRAKRREAVAKNKGAAAAQVGGDA